MCIHRPRREKADDVIEAEALPYTSITTCFRQMAKTWKIIKMAQYSALPRLNTWYQKCEYKRIINAR